jgi:ribosome-associated protein
MAPEPDELKVNRTLSIPRSELEVRASRSGGPGGQHVNTSSTRIEVVWNVKTSAVLFDDQRATIMIALGPRIAASGALRVVASDTRSQRQNRLLAEERLAEVVRKALVVKTPRKRTRPTHSAVERRLAEKKLRSERKRGRHESGDD